MKEHHPVHSVSSTKEYERCPARYRFSYLDRTEPTRHAPSNWRFGSVVHVGLEAGYRHRWIHDSSGGWHADPNGVAAVRWWTGSQWSMLISSHAGGPMRIDESWPWLVDEGWLPDPARRAAWRWWDGERFSAHISDGSAVWADDDGAIGQTPPGGEQVEPPPPGTSPPGDRHETSTSSQEPET